MRATREDPFIALFLSAYENCSWANAEHTKPDAMDRTNPAVDRIATRKSDAKKLAVEHTIIEPFVGDKEDFAFFEKAFLRIEKDETLAVSGSFIQVFVPVGTLKNQSCDARELLAQSVHAWIKSHRLTLPVGISQHRCAIVGTAAASIGEIELTVKATSSRQAALVVRRQQGEDDLDQVISKALGTKLPKLLNTPADKRLLILERQHMNLDPERILNEVENQRATFPALRYVNEIWILETIGYGTAGQTYFRFERFNDGSLVQSFDFESGRLTSRFEEGVAEVMDEEGRGAITGTQWCPPSI